MRDRERVAVGEGVSEGWMDGKENRETLWSGTRCLAGIRSGPHEAFHANTLDRKAQQQQQQGTLDRRTAQHFRTWSDRMMLE